MKAHWLAVVLVCSAFFAQAAARNDGSQKPEAKSAVIAERLRLEAPAPAAELALPALGAEAKRRLESALTPNQIGISRAAEVAGRPRIDASALRWERASGGFAAHIRVVSPEAAALRVGLRFDAMPGDLEIRVTAPDDSGEVVRTRVAELFKLTRGAWPIEHWTASTNGARQVIELWSPRKLVAGELRFVLFDVSHLFQRVLEPAGAKALQHACHIEMACLTDTSIRTDGRAVARMLFTDGGRSYLCTGALLNDRASSQTPLFASANHCISTAASAASLETWWFYYPDICGGLAPTPTRVIGGAALLMADFDTDFVLMRLAQSAPGGAYFLGWDPAPLVAGQAVFGIHHPAGDTQRFMAGTFLERTRVRDADTNITFGQLFNRIAVEQGITEGGSSGSPLITFPNSFRGTLFGGPVGNACGTGSIRSSYSDFSAVYPLVSTFLEGPAAADDHGDVPTAATAVNSGAKLVAQINRDGDADWFRIDFASAGTWTVNSFFPADGVRNDVVGEIYAADGVTLIAGSDDRSATDTNFEMTRVLTGATTLFLRVTGHAGTVGAYGLASSFILPDDHGDTPAAATNLAVPGTGSGFLGSKVDPDWFRVTIESAGILRASSTGTIDVVGRLYRADGTTLVAENDDANPFPDRNFLITATVAPGTYYLQVTGFDGDTGNYGLVTSFSLVSESANYTDLWWNSAESGWGINLNHQSETIFATLFTYAADGRDMWLVASGLARQPDGTFTGPLYRTVGPAFNASPWTAATVTQVGIMTLAFFGSNQATLTYTVNGVPVTKQIQRQAFGVAPTCTFTAASRATATNYQDLWWNPAESGWGINLTHQGDVLFATLFTYASDNRDLWLVASSLARQSDGSFAGALFRTTGPAFNAVPWVPVTVAPVGTMQLAFSSGTAGTLTYTVSGTTVTKQIQRQVFAAQPSVCQ